MLTDFKDSLSTFLKDNILWICLALVAIIIIVIVLILYFNRKNLKTFEKQVDILEQNIKNHTSYTDLLGGKKNLIKAYIKGSRVTVELLDNSLINKEKLHEAGVDSIIESSGKIILVSKVYASSIYSELNDSSMM